MRRYERRQGRLYRSRDGMIFGVCKGLADYWNLRVLWVRIIAVAILLCTGIFPIVVIYLIAALLMKPEPYGLGASLRACPYA